MNFTEDQPIYIQIAGWMGEKILQGEWAEGERIPSVRELGSRLEVNPNTAMRSYERMQALGAIDNKRGIGYFVTPGARQRLLDSQRAHFLQEELPQIFTRIDLLSLSFDEITRQYEAFKTSKHENKQ